MPQPTYFGNDLLPGGKQAGVSSIGSLPSSSGSSNTDDGGFDWGGWGTVKKGVGGAAGLLGSLFAPASSPDFSNNVKSIEGSAADLKKTGADLAGAGGEGLQKVLKYFESLASGDPSQALAATQPQRGRVIDQYDTARRSASQFTPRGGGQASTEQESRSREAGQLADTTAQARAEGAAGLASVGSDITRAGLSAEEQSMNALVATLQPLLQKSQQDSQSVLSTFAGLGELAMMFI